MGGLKKKEQEELKKLLLDEKRRVIAHLEELSRSSGKGMEPEVGDQLDVASTEISQAALQKIGKRESTLLKKIQYSLKKLEEGTYGECEECGELIAYKRLLARPVAQLCIDCKTEQESTERRFVTDREESDEDFNDDDS